MRYLITFIIIIILGSGLFLFYGNELQAYFSRPMGKSTVILDNVKLNVDVAKTNAERARGLSSRENLGDNEGMLFIFERPEHYTFWMKSMKFSIDIIWVNDGKVVDITPNVPVPGQDIRLSDLPRYAPSEPAQYVLEVKAGFAREHGIKKGDSVKVEQVE